MSVNWSMTIVLATVEPPPNLEPCPCCGSDAVVIETDENDEGNEFQYAECNDDACSLSGPLRSTYEFAVLAWNRIRFAGDRGIGETDANTDDTDTTTDGE